MSEINNTTKQLSKKEILKLIEEIKKGDINAKELGEVLFWIVNNGTDIPIRNISKNTRKKTAVGEVTTTALTHTLSKTEEMSEEQKNEYYEKLNNCTDDYVFNDEILNTKNGPWRAELLEYYINNRMNKKVKIAYKKNNEYAFIGENQTLINFIIDKASFHYREKMLDRLYIQQHNSHERISFEYELRAEDLYTLCNYDLIIGECTALGLVPNNNEHPFRYNDNNEVIFEVAQPQTGLKKIFIKNKDKKYSRYNDNVKIEILNNLWQFGKDHSTDDFLNIPSELKSI